MQKRIKGASICKADLSAYRVGLMRLSEVHIMHNNLSHDDIKHIGLLSIYRQKVVIGKIGNFWCIEGRTMEAELQATAQCGRTFDFKPYYIVVGKRITILHPSSKLTRGEYESKERLKPLNRMTPEEIFRAGGVNRLCKKREGKADSRSDIGRYKNRPTKSMYDF